jgi:hypothetical protein
LKLTQDLSNCNPLFPGYWLAIFVVQVNTIHKLSIDVKLLMESSTVTNAYWLAVSVSCKMTAFRSALGFGRRA